MRARSALFALCGVFHIGVVPCNKLQHICHNENSTVAFLFVCLFVCFFARNSGHFTWKRLHTTAAGMALPIPTSVCSIFVCPNNGTAAGAVDF